MDQRLVGYFLAFALFILGIAFGFVLFANPTSQPQPDPVIAKDCGAEEARINALIEERNQLQAKLAAQRVDVVVYDEARRPRRWSFKNLKSNEDIIWKTECGSFVFKAELVEK